MSSYHGRSRQGTPSSTHSSVASDRLPGLSERVGPTDLPISHALARIERGASTPFGGEPIDESRGHNASYSNQFHDNLGKPEARNGQAAKATSPSYSNFNNISGNWNVSFNSSFLGVESTSNITKFADTFEGSVKVTHDGPKPAEPKKH